MGNGKVEMIVDFHDDGSVAPIFPILVAKSLAKRMAGHVGAKTEGFGSGTDNPIRLSAADRAPFSALDKVSPRLVALRQMEREATIEIEKANVTPSQE